MADFYFKKRILIPVCCLLLLFTGFKNASEDWIVEQHDLYSLHYHFTDAAEKDHYAEYINSGIKSVQRFFHSSYKNKFEVYVYSSRSELDQIWQKDWKDTSFKSACWMVAGGTGSKLDLLSPLMWEIEACEHLYKNSSKTQKLITHELFHVFHGQLNPSPDFSECDRLDWLIEGFATYASEQCDSVRISEVKSAIQKKTIPGSIDNFWTGKLKYGLSGSLVLYIDKIYGREKLHDLLKLTKKDEVLQSLQLTEESLMSSWRSFITDYQ